ncbi:hypothetical protein BGZ82_001966, partial [Podila clonocystis]
TEAITIIEQQRETILKEKEVEVEVSKETVTEVSVETKETTETTIVTSTKETVTTKVAVEDVVVEDVVVEDVVEKVAISEEEYVAETTIITKESEVEVQAEVKVKEQEVEVVEETDATTIIEQQCEIIGTIITENGNTITLTASKGVVPEGCKKSKHGNKTVNNEKVSGSGSDESSASSSVLVLGKTQAGKSTFIEFVKNYSNQQYAIDESRLGTRFRSKTRMPVQFVVKTDLRAYEVFDANGTRIDIGSLGDQYQDSDDYFDALNNRNTTLKSVPHDHASSLPPRDVEITFLDTPGVEDTNGRDFEHAKSIIDAMILMQSFNLIIIVISCEDTLSKTLQLALNYYSKVIHRFQGHHSNIVFLYTHVQYEKCHRSNVHHLDAMENRHKAFSQLFRCQGSYNPEDVYKAVVETYPMYNIDLDKSQRPITKCMRLMTLREILTRVVDSPPVALDTSASNMQQIQAITHPDELNHACETIRGDACSP